MVCASCKSRATVFARLTECAQLVYLLNYSSKEASKHNVIVEKNSRNGGIGTKLVVTMLFQCINKESVQTIYFRIQDDFQSGEGLINAQA